MAAANKVGLNIQRLRAVDIDFRWDEAGYQKLKNSKAVHAYMAAQAERLAEQMRDLTDGPYRTKADYRAGNRYSDRYPIGTSRKGRGLHESIEARGPLKTGGTRGPDIPFSWNVGPHNYRSPSKRLSGSKMLDVVREGAHTGQGEISPRDFLAKAMEDLYGVSLRDL